MPLPPSFSMAQRGSTKLWFLPYNGLALEPADQLMVQPMAKTRLGNFTCTTASLKSAITLLMLLGNRLDWDLAQYCSMSSNCALTCLTMSPLSLADCVDSMTVSVYLGAVVFVVMVGLMIKYVVWWLELCEVVVYANNFLPLGKHCLNCSRAAVMEQM